MTNIHPGTGDQRARDLGLFVVSLLVVRLPFVNQREPFFGMGGVLMV